MESSLKKRKRDDLFSQGNKKAKKTRWGLKPSDRPIKLETVKEETVKEDNVEVQKNEKTKVLNEELLDQLLPSEGYTILTPPEKYKMVKDDYFQIPGAITDEGLIQELTYRDQSKTEQQGLPSIPVEDMAYFGKLLEKDDDDETLTPQEQKERIVLKGVLMIKNGDPMQRRKGYKLIYKSAKKLGPSILFGHILPLFLSVNLDIQERHYLVKLVHRLVIILGNLVETYTHQLLLVLSPMLIEEDYYTRIEARQVISSLAKAVGVDTIITVLRSDIGHQDEFVRNLCARTFAVVGHSIGVEELLPFVKAVCYSRQSWQTRHTGIRIIQRLAQLMNRGILPYLPQFVDAMKPGLDDAEMKVRTTAASALASLAEASAPYGIDAFEPILKLLWKGLYNLKGRNLAMFVKAFGFIIPLMNSEHASHYTKHVMDVILKQFSTRDADVKRIILMVIRQCAQTEGVTPTFLRTHVLDRFVDTFWHHQMTIDRRNYRELLQTTVVLGEKVGSSEIIKRIFHHLKDDKSGEFRKITCEVITKIIDSMGCADIDAELEPKLVDGMRYAFHNERRSYSERKFRSVFVEGLATLLSGLNKRSERYLPNICGEIKFRMNNRIPEIRQGEAELAAKLAPILREHNPKALLALSQMFYEQLDEEYSEVLASIIKAIKEILLSVEIENMKPPIRDLLPRLTPIMMNRNEHVRQETIEIIGIIATNSASQISSREWMRICLLLVELLKSQDRRVKKAAIATFGFIAQAIGPQEVLTALLDNLKVQERSLRICTTLGIAIVAETCGPFTVLPGLMNEYSVLDKNVQNGVLKALAFLFEYVGDLSKDYIFSVVPLIQDALLDRDVVHRQISCQIVRNLALGCAGYNCEEALIHLLNMVWPNIFDQTVHFRQAIYHAIDGLRVGLGPQIIYLYCLTGLFHPSRNIRNTYWDIHNNLVLYGQDRLVPVYPRLDEYLPNNEGERYKRQELEIFI